VIRCLGFLGACRHRLVALAGGKQVRNERILVVEQFSAAGDALAHRFQAAPNAAWTLLRHVTSVSQSQAVNSYRQARTTGTALAGRPTGQHFWALRSRVPGCNIAGCP
jgi:hypothetical protein